MTLLNTYGARYFGRDERCSLDYSLDTAAITRPQARCYLSDYSTASIVVGFGEPSYGNWALSLGVRFAIPHWLWDYFARRAARGADTPATQEAAE